MRSSALVIVILMTMLFTAAGRPALAGTIDVQTGLAVPLRFLAPVDASTIQKGATIPFRVAANILVGRTTVFREGAPGQGIVTDVGHPDVYGTSAHVRIAFIQATAVDGRPVRLSPLDLSPDSGRQAEGIGGAVAASVAAAVVFHSILGLAAGTLIHGGDVSLPAGTVRIATVAGAFSLTTR